MSFHETLSNFQKYANPVEFVSGRVVFNKNIYHVTDMSKRKFNHQWLRVFATHTPQNEVIRQRHNKRTFKSKNFKKACELAGIEPTTRQASKWNNRKGLAFKTSRGWI